MIVSMKKTTVLCLADDRGKTLDSLAGLGLMHIRTTTLEDSKNRAELQKLHHQVVKTLGIIKSHKLDNTLDRTKDVALADGKTIYEKCTQLIEEQEDCRKKVELLKREVEQLKPWGEFDHQEIDILRQKEIYVYLCVSSDKELVAEKEKNPKAIRHVISSSKGRVYYALLSEVEINPRDLPVAPVPDHHSLKESKNLLHSELDKLEVLNRQLDELTLQIPQLEKYLEKISEGLEFAVTMDSMQKHDTITSLSGFIPVTEVEKLKTAALKNGWALLLQDPDNDEPVPTLIKLPKWLNFAKVITDFIGVSQGYREADVSVCFLIFFALFFGMIAGDGGYGLIFTAVSLTAWIKFKNRSQKLQDIAKLSVILSLSSLIFGTLSGNFFGIDKKLLPEFMRGINFLSGPESDANLQWLCFLIAMIHLCLARIWRTMLARGWRNKIGEIGWAMLLIGNFYTAAAMIAKRDFPEFAFAFYAGGIVLTLVGMNWRNVGEVFNYPFGVIGTFTDTLSYIRLYAVGLSGVYIAESFNKMGGMITDIPAPDWSLPLLIAGAILIIVAGHLLNIALALMGVLVHGIRLNTLEFSTHMGLQWAGFAFKPFKKTTKQK